LGITQPQTNELRLHALVHHLQQIGAQSLEVGLVAHCAAEGRQYLGGVVLAAVEALVDDRLDAAA
jgi:hypothetical protein